MRRAILIFLSTLFLVPSFSFGEKNNITLLSDPSLYPCSEVYSHGEENVIMAYNKVKRYFPGLGMSIFGLVAAVATVSTGGVGGIFFVPAAVIAFESIAIPTVITAVGAYKLKNPLKQAFLDRRISKVLASAESFLFEEGNSSAFKGFYKKYFKTPKDGKVIYSVRDVALALNWLDHAHKGVCDVKPYHMEEDSKLFFRFFTEKEIVISVKAFLDEKYASKTAS